MTMSSSRATPRWPCKLHPARGRLLAVMEQPSSRVVTVVKLIVIALLLVLVNGYREGLVLPVFHIEGVAVTSISGLGVPVPWGALNIWLFLAFILNVLHLSYRRWTVETRWIELSLGLFAVGIWWSIFRDARDVFANGVPLSELDADAQRALANVLLTVLASASSHKKTSPP